MTSARRGIVSRIFCHRYLHPLGRFALGAFFVWAGAMKLAAPRAFAATVSRFDLVPEWGLPVIAIGLPLLEIAAGAWAMMDRKGGLPAILGLLLFFVAFLGVAWISGIDVDCGCFGPAETETHGSVRTAILRNILLIAGTGWLMRLKRIDAFEKQSSTTTEEMT